ncbi:MAG TPA: hypothetical protein VI248_27125 [Kineosporiaceae bacterium]
MHGLGDAGHSSATAKLHEQLQSSRMGQRWERMLRLHAHEVEAVLAVHADVRQDVEKALRLLCETEELDHDTTSAVERVLDDLQRHASVPLQRDITLMRDEVALSRGRTLTEVLRD